jgi:hypothetical protein
MSGTHNLQKLLECVSKVTEEELLQLNSEFAASESKSDEHKKEETCKPQSPKDSSANAQQTPLSFIESEDLSTLHNVEIISYI